MKKYIEPITELISGLTSETFLTSATAGGEVIGDEPIGPGGGGGDAKEREEFDEFMEFMENENNENSTSLW